MNPLLPGNAYESVNRVIFLTHMIGDNELLPTYYKLGY